MNTSRIPAKCHSKQFLPTLITNFIDENNTKNFILSPLISELQTISMVWAFMHPKQTDNSIAQIENTTKTVKNTGAHNT